MTGAGLRRLRDVAGLTQAEAARDLGVSVRTVAGWEADERALPAAEAARLKDLLLEPILGPMLARRCELAYLAVPSEVVSIWYVDHASAEAVRLASAHRIQDLGVPTPARREFDTTRHAVSLRISRSLTTWPLRSGELIELSGDAIQEHPQKRQQRHRFGFDFAQGRCESLLFVPYFVASPGGPEPVLLLALENRIVNGGVTRDPADGTYADVVPRARALIRELAEDPLPDERLSLLTATALLGLGRG